MTGTHANRCVVALVLLMLAVTCGCSSRLVKPDDEGTVFSHSLERTRTAALNALVVSGFETTREEPHYLEAHRPIKWGAFAQSGGETVGLWLQEEGATRTRVHGATRKAAIGRAVQREWEGSILEEMQTDLAGSQ